MPIVPGSEASSGLSTQYTYKVGSWMYDSSGHRMCVCLHDTFLSASLMQVHIYKLSKNIKADVLFQVALLGLTKPNTVIYETENLQ